MRVFPKSYNWGGKARPWRWAGPSPLNWGLKTNKKKNVSWALAFSFSASWLWMPCWTSCLGFLLSWLLYHDGPYIYLNCEPKEPLGGFCWIHHHNNEKVKTYRSTLIKGDKCMLGTSNHITLLLPSRQGLTQPSRPQTHTTLNFWASCLHLLKTDLTDSNIKPSLPAPGAKTQAW